MPNNSIVVKDQLKQGLQALCDANLEVMMVSLCTTDGFPIHTVMSGGVNVNVDKMAAMSSTIAALSDSSAKQLLNDSFDISIIETASGNVLFVSCNYLTKPCVLTVVASTKMALATARYKTTGLAKEIAKI